MSDMTLTDPVRALRGALERMRRAMQAVAGDAAQYPGIEEDLAIAERAVRNLRPVGRASSVRVVVQDWRGSAVAGASRSR